MNAIRNVSLIPTFKSKMPCRELSKMSAEEVAAFVRSFDTVMTDCDGVLWNSAGAIDGSPGAVNKFRESGKRVFFCTNNSTKTRSEYVEKCRDLGFGDTKKEEVVGTSYLTATYLKNINFKGKVYVIGSKALCQGGFPVVFIVNHNHTCVLRQARGRVLQICSRRQFQHFLKQSTTSVKISLFTRLCIHENSQSSCIYFAEKNGLSRWTFIF